MGISYKQLRKQACEDGVRPYFTILRYNPTRIYEVDNAFLKDLLTRIKMLVNVDDRYLLAEETHYSDVRDWTELKFRRYAYARALNWIARAIDRDLFYEINYFKKPYLKKTIKYSTQQFKSFVAQAFLKQQRIKED